MLPAAAADCMLHVAIHRIRGFIRDAHAGLGLPEDYARKDMGSKRVLSLV